MNAYPKNVKLDAYEQEIPDVAAAKKAFYETATKNYLKKNSNSLTQDE